METERIQALVYEGLNQLPSKFIRPEHEQPDKTKAIEGVEIPIISLSQPHDQIVHEISTACIEWGFFLIKDHGIPQILIQRLRDVGHEFFKLPQEEKEKYANDPSKGSFEGYGTKMTKNLEEKLEWVDYYFHMMYPPNKVNYHMWPQNPLSYRKVAEEYNVELLRITFKLLELLSEGLGLEKNIIKSTLGGEEKIEMEMKINMYPPCPQPELALGVEPHTDMSALTLLVPNNVPGLQVWKDGNWVAVQYIDDAIFVHVGDQLEILSNGKYKSVLHRSLVNKVNTRMSWAVFVTPPHEAMIGPLPGVLDEKNPAKYSTKTYAKYSTKTYAEFNKLPQ